MNKKSTYKFKQSKHLPANRKRKPKSDVFKLIAVLVISLALLFVLISIIRYKDAHAEPKPVEIRLSEYIDGFFDGIFKNRNKKVKAYIPFIIDAALETRVDPFFIAETISSESSWRFSVVGSGGEIGLGQQMKHLARSADLTTPKGQIDQIAKRLKEALDTCNHPLPAIQQYRSGSCYPIDGKSRYRYMQYLKTNERYGE